MFSKYVRRTYIVNVPNKSNNNVQNTRKKSMFRKKKLKIGIPV